MEIRRVTPQEAEEWVRMRCALYGGSIEEYQREAIDFFAGKYGGYEVHVVQRDNGKLAGFVELNIRNYVEGSSLERVAYLEGWYVDPDCRGRGVGRRLLELAERWAREKGFTELGSDSNWDNADGIAAHRAVGFAESERIVYFIKKLE